jgi:hypothetical protein
VRVCLMIEGQLEQVGVERVFLQHLDHPDLDAVALMGELS